MALRKNYIRAAVILTSLLVFSMSQSLVAETLSLTSEMKNVELSSIIEYLEDKTAKVPLKKLLDETGDFPVWNKNNKKNLSFGYTSSAYWIRLKLKNATTEKVHFRILQDYPLIDYLSLYVVKNGIIYDRVDMGDQFPFSKRKLFHRSFVFPLVLLPGEEAEYYFRYFTGSSLKANLTLWSPEPFQEFQLKESAVMWLYYGFLIIMFLYNLFVFISVRDSSYFYYILWLFLFTLFLMSINGLAFQYLWPNAVWWHNNSPVYLQGLFNFAVVFFTRDFCEIKKHSRPAYWIITGVGVGALCIILLNFFIETYRIRIVITTSYNLFLIFIVVPIAAWVSIRERVRAGAFFMIAFGILILGSVGHLLMNLGVLPVNIMTRHGIELGSAFEVILLSLGLADRINVMKKELEVLNSGLEDKVQERTGELQNSLFEVQKLKARQDIDYFLTSLLLGPFQADQNNSSSVNSQIVVAQFKRFQYREEEGELGGDICIIDTVVLQNHTYVFFTNADAMGKSMQGAGGALVYGAAIRARLVQARSNSSKTTPELWLRDLYFELHGLFQSFEGRMLITGIFGLIDEKSGMMWFINAEHPLVCVFRDEQAFFIGENKVSSKLGVAGQIQMNLQMFNLEPEDRIIMGSDGKDDIYLGSHPEQEWNFDETLFLKWVRDAEGDGIKISELISQKGILRDDFSLISLHWSDVNATLRPCFTEKERIVFNDAMECYGLKDYETALTLLIEEFNHKPVHKAVLRIIGHIYVRKGYYEKNYELLLKYYQLFPGDGYIIFLLSKACLHLQNPGEALDWAESLYLRDPTRAVYVRHVLEICRRTGNLEKAQKLIGASILIQPDNLELDGLHETYSESLSPADGRDNEVPVDPESFVY